jgi:hypothetical protein
MREHLVHEPHVELRVADQRPEEQGPVQQIERHLDVQSASDLPVGDRPFPVMQSLRPAHWR